MKRAFGALDLLITLVVTAIIFMIGANAFKGVSSIKVNGSSDVKSIEQEVDRQVGEIENMRRQTIEFNNTEVNY